MMRVPQDLTPPPMMDAQPAPGRRVRQVAPGFAGTAVYHALDLPVDWESGRKYPVIVEYAGNRWRTCTGTPEGSSLGYGVSGGRGFVWVCMPFVDTQSRQNALTWWGDVEATVGYCRETVSSICDEYGGDESAVLLAGFSRGAIACNYIGLHDDDIGSLWRGFICHSHYDGVREWPYPGSDRDAAAARLMRLKGRPQFISQEISEELPLDMTRRYLLEVCPEGDFTFVDLPFREHTDTWVLRDTPERGALRTWVQEALGEGTRQTAA
jgi:hypothetical protein